MKTDKKIIPYTKLKKLGERLRKENKTISFTSGCYDILHLGHLMHFNLCKSKGDVFLISLGNDKTITDLKGPGRPVNNESFRARMLAALELVDYVVISEESGIMDHNKIVELLKPTFYVVPETDKFIDQKKALIEKNSGKLITCKRIPPDHLKGGISTTKIIEKLSEE